MPKGNTVTDLNDTLFELMDRLMDAESKEEVEKETRVAKAVSSVANMIIANHTNIIKAAKVKAEYGTDIGYEQILIGNREDR